jgi:hypothetical protein
LRSFWRRAWRDGGLGSLGFMVGRFVGSGCRECRRRKRFMAVHAGEGSGHDGTGPSGRTASRQ